MSYPFWPNLLTDPDNFTSANPLVTPPPIKPEWYFLFAYAILRSIPNKLGGVLALAFSIVALIFIPLIHTSRQRNYAFRPFSRYLFWVLITNTLVLTWIGGQPVEDPFILIGQLASCIYFLTLIAAVPLLGWLENKSLN